MSAGPGTIFTGALIPTVTRDFLLRAPRDRNAAIAFFRKTVGASHTTPPRVVNVDKNPASPIAVEAIKHEGLFRPRSSLRQCKYLNNVIEQDHRCIKRRTRPMLGFKRFTTAWRTVRGIEMMHALRNGTGTVDGEGRRGRSDAADPQGVRIGRVARSTQRTLARDPKRCNRTLQGVRSTVSGLNGTYQIPGLPPGDYSVIFEMDGFATVDDVVTVPLGGDVSVNVAMEPGAVAELVQVTSVPPPVSSTEASRNLTADEFGVLPIGRSLFRLAELSPGLTTNAPNRGQLTINGAFSYDNVFLVDGVDVNDNIFGTEINLFIEDTIEEAHVLTSGVSAEYGRFSGGVINIITKSGSNTFSGGFRSNLYKPDWTGRTPFEVANDAERTGSLANNTSYETTLGGPVVEDRLWFFYANRRQRSNETETFGETGISYDDTLANDRNLIKLTATIRPGHQLQGSYMRNGTDDTGPTFGFTIDPAGIRTRQVPADLVVATYRGAATSRLFTEFQFSRRRFGFRNNGGRSTDIAESPFLTLTQAFGHYNAPYFDAADPQNRDNRPPARRARR